MNWMVAINDVDDDRMQDIPQGSVSIGIHRSRGNNDEKRNRRMVGGFASGKEG